VPQSLDRPDMDVTSIDRSVGDDLIAAREFCHQAKPALTLLLSSGRLDHLAAQKALTTIREHAVPLSARAIIRNVDLALSMIETHKPQPKIDGKLMMLNKLVLQYEAGLDEITAATPIPHSVENPPLEAKHAAAQNILTPLIRFSNNPKTTAALSFLADIPYTIKAPSKTVHKIVAGQPGHYRPFETLMAGLTNFVLSTARLHEKNVSLSYAIHDAEFLVDDQEPITAWLQHILQHSIEHYLETPDIRQSKGLSQTTPLNLTAQSTPAGLIIEISGHGQGKDTPELPLPKDLTTETHIENDQFKIILKCPADRIPAPAIISTGRGEITTQETAL